MEEKIKSAIEEYQCSGCISGGNITCFVKNPTGVGCDKHKPGTLIYPIGYVFLGMPNGFNRLGEQNGMKIYVFKDYESCDWKYNKFNVPMWKHLTKIGHTIVRGCMPRLNQNFIHVFLEDCMDKINCLQITEEDINEMD